MTALPAVEPLIRVVLADDTPDVRMLVRTALEMAGDFDVVGEAADGAEAVDVIGRCRPDVAVLDLAMPVMDGLEALPMLRDVSPATRVVVLSGFEPEAIAADVLELGAARYVQKGRSLPELTATIREVAGRAAVMNPPRKTTKVQSDFVAEVVHELRNPLTTVTGLADTLLLHWDRLSDDRRIDLVRAVKRQGQRAGSLVDDLLSAARLDGGQLSISLELVEIGALLATIVGDRAVELRAEPGLTVHADPHRVEQIVTNLLDNADRYGAPPIVVTAAAHGDHAHISVRDHGAGVDLEDRSYLFERFSALARGKEGSNGLGLYIARGLARAMRGDVSYESGAPGACFTLRLPLATA